MGLSWIDPFCPYFVKRTENSTGFISLIQLRPRRKRLGLAPSRDSSLNLTPCCEGNRTDGQRTYGEAGVRWPESCLFTGMMETEPASPPRHKHLSFDGLLPTGSIINSCLSKSLSPESSPRTQWAPAADHLLEEDGLPRTSDTTGFT